MMTEVRPGLKTGLPIPAGAPEISSGALCFSIPLSVGDDAAVLVCATEENWLAIGSSALLAAGLTEIRPADARGTFLEVISQATSGLAQALASKLNKPVSSLPALEIRSVAVEMIPVEIALGEPPAPRIYVGWSAGLECHLAPPGRKSSGGAQAVAKSPTFDLLMEVELPVSVSFGRAELPLRDVLKLNSGSIVELNRTISDPVEIIVNNCVIARGEVVVVDGNYGVRIHQVVSREERLRTLK